MSRARPAVALTDGGAVVLAVATAAGAIAARPLPPLIGVLGLLIAFACRRPWLLWLASAALASGLAASAWAGLHPPTPAAVDASVTLLRDPAELGGATRAVARLGRRHVEVSARGAAGRVLGRSLAGERIHVVGRIGPVAPSVRSLLARQHVAAGITATEIRAVGPGNPPSRVANGIRRLLVRGASSMSPDERALFTGFVLGDDRGQSVATVDDFRSSGLSHLLVVSGENVAFVLTLAGPLLRVLGLRWRLVTGLLVLATFGVLTRWEPSVLRAEAMAAIALVAQVLGRPVSTVRLLALAVTGLLLLDPLLVGSVGFLLSVGACAGIALLSAPLTAVLPGPRPLAAAFGVTLSAQAGVAPVLVPVFGPMPVATLPANLLAVPAAGPVMMWGVVAGLPAGLVGGPVATVLHLPTRLLVGWIALVARTTASAPLGRLGASAVLALGVLLATAAGIRPLRGAAICGAALVLAWPGFLLAVRHQPQVDGRPLVAGARLWRSGGAAVLVIDRPQPGRLLTAVRAAGLRRIDVVVVRRGGARTVDALDPLARRVAIGAVVAPHADAFTGPVVVARPGLVAQAGPLRVRVLAVSPQLDARVERGPPSPGPARLLPAER